MSAIPIAVGVRLYRSKPTPLSWPLAFGRCFDVRLSGSVLVMSANLDELGAGCLQPILLRSKIEKLLQISQSPVRQAIDTGKRRGPQVPTGPS